MDQGKAVIGFFGSGGIARAHAFALNSLPYYYDDCPEIELEAVCSQRPESRKAFAKRFGFRSHLSVSEFITNTKVNTVFILGPNNVHFEHLGFALGMPSVKRVYVEKPLCSTSEETSLISQLAAEHPGIKIQVGFQYLFSAPVREALIFWKSGVLGTPIHFEFKYYHGDYLKGEYRAGRKTRLTPSPDGGAMADLGSHAISILIAFLGNKLKITGALQAGHFEDVPEDSDLFSLINLYDTVSGAAGTLSASRISSGTGDLISFEIYAEKGALRYTTGASDNFEYFLENSGVWIRQPVASNYKPSTTFPSVHVPAGWLRSMIHAHYSFLSGNDTKSFIPDIDHGLDVQNILNLTADHLRDFRGKVI
jgi:predicted dehydrogenase